MAASESSGYGIYISMLCTRGRYRMISGIQNDSDSTYPVEKFWYPYDVPIVQQPRGHRSCNPVTYQITHNSFSIYSRFWHTSPPYTEGHVQGPWSGLGHVPFCRHSSLDRHLLDAEIEKLKNHPAPLKFVWFRQIKCSSAHCGPANIGSGYGMSPVSRQAVIANNANYRSEGTLIWMKF